jgi:hypothetical protein
MPASQERIQLYLQILEDLITKSNTRALTAEDNETIETIHRFLDANAKNKGPGPGIASLAASVLNPHAVPAAAAAAPPAGFPAYWDPPPLKYNDGEPMNGNPTAERRKSLRPHKPKRIGTNSSK